MTKDKIGSYLLHAMVGVLITAAPALMANIPDTILSMTVGGILGMGFKFLHDWAGY